MAPRFDKFTERAKKTFVFAEEEARRFDHNYIGTEHILLGLVRESEGTAGRVLSLLGVAMPKVREAVVSIVGFGASPVAGAPPLTPRAKKAIELALDEARRLRHRYIGTEHLLLGLLREGEGVAVKVLERLGMSREHVREQVERIILSEHDPVRSPLPEFVWQRVKRGAGRPPLHGERMQSLRVNIPREVSRSLATVAESRATSQSEIVRLALEKWLGENATAPAE